VRLEDFRAVWDLTGVQLRTLAQHSAAEQHGGELVTAEVWRSWHQKLLDECETRHRHDPALQGMQENEFDGGVPVRFRSELLKALVADGKLEQQAGRFRPKLHQVVLAPEEEKLFQRLQPLLNQPQPPSVGDIGKAVGIALPLLQRGIKGLASKKVIVLINDKRVYLPEQVRPLVEIALKLSDQGPFTARQFRDAAEIGRNVAIDILEYFDSKGFTRRTGDNRTVVGSADRALPSG
jgi:selenocysteine-specific elongation factor